MVHFSGHGTVSEPKSGGPLFGIKLDDVVLDPQTWRELAGRRTSGGAFYFFNACDIGRTRSFGGFVQGWGPTILASGAGGFVGGLWPLLDRSAPTP